MKDIEELYRYRLEQAKTTLAEAETMLEQSFSSRTIINRTYYAAFYMVLALFLKTGISVKSSKHTGIMGIFDKEFILNGRIGKEYSRILHTLFDCRLEFDYKDYAAASHSEARTSIENARKFISEIERFLSGIEG